MAAVDGEVKDFGRVCVSRRFDPRETHAGELPCRFVRHPYMWLGSPKTERDSERSHLWDRAVVREPCGSSPDAAGARWSELPNLPELAAEALTKGWSGGGAKVLKLV